MSASALVQEVLATQELALRHELKFLREQRQANDQPVRSPSPTAADEEG